jgi:zinc/manganese transport system permease protein
MPTGAAMVTAQAGFLLLAGLARVLIFVHGAQRQVNLRIAAYTVAAAILSVLLASSVWLMIAPTGDQPLLALVERATGIGPARFLGPADRDTYESAVRDTMRFQDEADRLDASEKASRSREAPLSDDEIRRIASYQQSFNEMTRGERFVQEVLRGKARMRERWIVGVPIALFALLGLLGLGHRFHKHRGPREYTDARIGQ